MLIYNKKKYQKMRMKKKGKTESCWVNKNIYAYNRKNNG